MTPSPSHQSQTCPEIDILTNAGFPVEQPFPDWYYAQYCSGKFPQAEQPTLEMLKLSQPETVQSACLKLGALMWFAKAYPQIWAGALSSNRDFIQCIAEQIKAAGGLSGAYIKRGSILARYQTFELGELEFDVGMAQQIIADEQGSIIIADLTYWYEAMKEQFEVFQKQEYLAEADLTKPIIIASVPPCFEFPGDVLVIDGMHRMFKSWRDRQGIVILPAYQLTLEQTERCLMSETVRPLWAAYLEGWELPQPEIGVAIDGSSLQWLNEYDVRPIAVNRESRPEI